MIINKRIQFPYLIWFLANRILWRHKDDANLGKIFLETARSSTDLEDVIFAPKQKANQQQMARPRRTRDENPKAEVENVQKKQSAPPKLIPAKKQKVNTPNQMTLGICMNLGQNSKDLCWRSRGKWEHRYAFSKCIQTNSFLVDPISWTLLPGSQKS